MKNLVLTLTITLFSISNIQAQKLSAHSAGKLFHKTIACLKTNDTITFVGQWFFDNMPWPDNNATFDHRNAGTNFGVLKKFIDSALRNNMSIDKIEIEKENPGNKTTYYAQYKITAWFNYSASLRKGIAFNVDYTNGKWVYRFQPDYVEMENAYDTKIQYLPVGKRGG
jgi:hypothetical protein